MEKGKDVTKAPRTGLADKSRDDSLQIEIRNADKNLESCMGVFKDPELTGEQVLKFAHAEPTKNFMVVRILENGQIENFPLDEKINMRDRKDIECLVLFKKENSPYRIKLDQNEYEWDKPVISGRVVKELTGVDLEKYEVFCRMPGPVEDEKIEDSILFCLDLEDVKHFFTNPKDLTDGE